MKSGWNRRIQASFVATFVVAVTALTPTAFAAGNIQIIQGGPGEGNNPQKGACQFEVKFTNFTNVTSAVITATLQAPTSGTLNFSQNVTLSGGAEEQLVAVDLGPSIYASGVPPKTTGGDKGWKVNIVATASDDDKTESQKMVWVDGCVADLRVTKTTNTSPILVQNNTSFTLAVSNAGPSDVTAKVTDTLPAALQFVSSNPTSPTCTASGQVVTCNVFVASGGTTNITITAKGLTTGTHTNNVSVSSTAHDPNTANNSASSTVTVNDVPATRLKIVKDIDSESNQTAEFDFNTNVGGWTIPDLGVGDDSEFSVTSTGTFTVTETIPLGWETPHVNCAGDTSGGSTSNSTISTATFSVSQADLDNRLTITCTFTNEESPRATLKVVKDIEPGSDQTAQFAFNSNVGGWTIPNLGDGGSDDTTVLDANTYTVTETVPGGWRTPMVNCVGGSGTNTSNQQTATAFFQVTAADIANEAEIVCTFTNSELSSDLSVTKTDNQTSVLGGAILTYVLTVTNNGPDAATGVSVVDTIPAGTTFTTPAPTASQGTCAAPTATTVSCAIGGLASGDSATVTVNVKTPPVTSTTVVTNSATVSGNENDPNSQNNTGIDTTTLNPQIINVQSADLSLTKNDAVDPVEAGQDIVYTLTVSNAGPNTATNVSVNDTLPTGLAFVSASASQGSCNGASPLSCSLGNLSSGQTVTIMVVASTSNATSGTVVNTASVSSSAADPNLGNNQDSETTTVVQPLPPEKGRIVVEKRTLPAGATAVFQFTGDAAGSLRDGETLVFDVDAGTYASTESPKNNWTLTDVVCDDGDSSGSVGAATATFRVAEGETVKCTFTSTRDEVLPKPPIENPSDPEPEDPEEPEEPKQRDRVKGTVLPSTGGALTGMISLAVLFLLSGATLVLGVRRGTREDPWRRP